MSYRNLSSEEIARLRSQGCYSEDWQTVMVKEPFQPDCIRNACFGGKVQIGVFSETENPGTRRFGIYDSEIRDCTIEDGVLIADVSLLQSYTIGRNAVLRNVGSVVVEGKTAFGNGTEIAVLNEGGGRTIKMYDRLTAQIAYLMALYRQRPRMLECLNSVIDGYVESCKSSQGEIGENTAVVNCKILKNVRVGSFVRLEGVERLEEGTLVGNSEEPVTIGNGVYAKHFIVQSGSTIDSAAILTHVFVGQAVKIGKQFSAENSAFFANCEGFHGEACSIFAGPYTVSHHKSTLLIAGLFSFYNAGSGTNQSNHMYKLGPNHQGILERGSKTGSFSYLLWPSVVGPFSVVIGKHYTNFDTSDLPFSYLNEEEGKSVLTPAMNLFTVGTRRDSQKWPSRDRRKKPEPLDLIHFDLFNPYTIGKVLKAISILNSLYENASKEQEFVSYNGVSIKRLMLKTCRKYYEMAVKIFIGDCLVSRLKAMPETAGYNEILASLSYEKTDASMEWTDVSGLLAPRSSIESLAVKLEKFELTRLDELNEELRKIYCEYGNRKWEWCCRLIEKTFGSTIESLSKAQLIQIVKDWQECRVKFNNMIVQDAWKEFDKNARIGYGLDGDESAREMDFEAVRGNKDTNSFIRELRKENETTETLAASLIQKIGAE